MVRQICAEAQPKTEALHSVIGQKRLDSSFLVHIQFVVSEFGPHAVAVIHRLAFYVRLDIFFI